MKNTERATEWQDVGSIGFTKNSDLLDYIYYNNLMNLKNNATLVYGVSDAMVDVRG